MAQIFISHSSKDEKTKDFFSKIFAGTGVKALFEEFEKIMSKDISSQRIEKDIEISNAIFVILSSYVEKLHPTRDWILWEIGRAKNKEVWIFEPLYDEIGKSSYLSVVIPNLNHLVIFVINDAYFKYIRNIVESYDDSHILPTVLLSGGSAAIGSLFGPIGTVVGATIGAWISPKPHERPNGVQIKCIKCSSVYFVHTPEGLKGWRCPVCNSYLIYKDTSS